MLILIFLLILQTLTYKVEWDEANASNYVPDGNIIKFNVHGVSFIYLPVVYGEADYFVKSYYQTYQVAYCENGLTLVPEDQTPEPLRSDLIKYIEIIYVKYITEDVNLKLYVFQISGDDFPLVICPYKRWVRLYSGTEFIPYEETNGIMYNEFRHRHIILPAYPRNDDTDIFVCGSIKYKDGSQLTISYIMELVNYYDIKSNEPINDIKDIWKCSDYNKISDNYYFLYSKNDKILNKMKYIEYNSRNSSKFDYNDIMYIYKENPELAILKYYGYHIHGTKIEFITTKPSCKRTLPQLKFKLKLVSPDGANNFDSGNETQILDVSENMLNKEFNYKCKIFVEEASNYPFLSNYYDNVMEVSLVSKDDDGNKIFHDTIKFKDNFDSFKKYECEIRLKDNKFNYKYVTENLSFITIPPNISIKNQNEEWREKEDVVIQCQRRLSNIGEIDRIKMEVSENFFAEYSNLTSNGIFNIEGDYVRTNYENLIKSKRRKNSNVKSITTICIYKVMGGRILSIVKNGTVVQKTIITKKVYKSDQGK